MHDFGHLVVEVEQFLCDGWDEDVANETVILAKIGMLRLANSERLAPGTFHTGLKDS